MREIGLYRGIRKDNGTWVEGYYSKHKSGKVFIKEANGGARSSFEVDPETVGEFIGRYGVYGSLKKRVWEGDLVSFAGENYAVVEFVNGRFSLNWLSTDKYILKDDLLFSCDEKALHIRGNIYDNKDLIADLTRVALEERE